MAEPLPDESYRVAWTEMRDHLSWALGHPLLNGYLGQNIAAIATDLVQRAYPQLHLGRPLLRISKPPEPAITGTKRGDALAKALCLLDSLAGEGIGHVYGNGQTINADDCCSEVAEAFGVDLDVGWYRTVGAIVAAGAPDRVAGVGKVMTHTTNDAPVTVEIEPLALRLAIAQVASCSCDTKTHEARYHDQRCLYRVLQDAQAEIDRLTVLNDKYFWQVRDTCTRAEKAEAALASAPADQSAAYDRLERHLDEHYYAGARDDLRQVASTPAGDGVAALQKQIGELIDSAVDRGAEWTDRSKICDFGDILDKADAAIAAALVHPHAAVEPVEPTPDQFTALGKQVLLNGQHYADACSPTDAARIARLLNADGSLFDDRDQLREHLRVELGDAYDCTRVWEAWGVNTMSEDDFTPVNDRLEQIVDGLMGLVAK